MLKNTLKLVGATAFLLTLSLNVYAVDTTNPSDVENFTGTPGDSKIDLKWDAATDDTGIAGYVVYYGLSPVTEPGQSYDENKDVGNVTEYTLDGLTNGAKYYLSVIAYDEAKNESEAWATELSVTPNAEGLASDSVSPQVSSAEAVSKEEVKVVFSEEIVLPSENAETEFAIENQETFEPLEVKSVKMDEEDTENKTVILETATQTKDNEYKLTVNIGIKDKAGNNIISGTSDTALFNGSDKEKMTLDIASPKLLSVEVLDTEHLVLQFDEAVVLSLDPTANFTIVQKNDGTKKLSIKGVELGKSDAGVDNASVLLTTEAMSGTVYMVSAVNLKDMAGNTSVLSETTKEFTGLGENPGEDGTDEDDDVPADDDEDDTLASELVAKFMAKTVFENDSMVVKLSWDIITATKDQIDSQKIYMSKNSNNKFALKETLGADVNKYDVVGLDSGDYWFKITTIDKDGKESAGLMTNKVTIAETGPGLLGLAVFSLGLGGIIRKKKLS
jgi:hypothetical protein